MSCCENCGNQMLTKCKVCNRDYMGPMAVHAKEPRHQQVRKLIQAIKDLDDIELSMLHQKYCIADKVKPKKEKKQKSL